LVKACHPTMFGQLNAFQGEEHQPFEWEGGRPAALLVHGFPGSPAEMRPIAEILHAQGWTTHGVLLPGFGPEVENLADKTQEEWMIAVSSRLSQLQRRHRPVILVGNSMGGALAITVAAQSVHPPDGLILFSPFWKVPHIAWDALPFIKLVFPNPRIFKYLNLDFNDPEVRDGIHNFMPSADLDDPEVQQAIRDFPVPIKMFSEIRRTGQAAHKAALSMQTPALVIQGRQDHLVRPDLTRKLISRFRAPVWYRAVQAEHNAIDPSLPDWASVRQEVLSFANRLTEKANSSYAPLRL
jgi:carboxylesterase